VRILQFVVGQIWQQLFSDLIRHEKNWLASKRLKSRETAWKSDRVWYCGFADCLEEHQTS